MDDITEYELFTVDKTQDDEGETNPPWCVWGMDADNDSGTLVAYTDTQGSAELVAEALRRMKESVVAQR